ncbi:hypothetical protein AZE42_10491 [Rhizopogon vesiculosus]|uniref:XPG-I domain-containing protein n=1 Tax=Rhizopogon vesiculosus TaxID=180088 RepID=A0A1J8Q0P7_9AGAM|nr:hypothetical protein AZE42_10491 [Rhizopogon vesiculosus]
MGITNLWKLVSLTIYGQTLTVFALEGLRGHVQDDSGISMMTIGVDASAWLYAVCKLQAFQFRHAQLGENPKLQTLMYKLVALASAPIHAHFVFNGDDHPSIKRGKHVRSAPHWLTQHLQELLNIFGFTWSTAKGEAKADLAFLSKAGRIAAVLTEDSDAILFDDLTSADNDNGTFKVDVYYAGAPSKDLQVLLTTGHLLLCTMLCGGDYNLGRLAGCGGQVAQALLKGDLGDSLMHVMTSATPVQLPSMLETWRGCLRTILVNGTLGRKHLTLAASIPADFPSIDVMRLYLHPVTSWSDTDGSPTLPQFGPTQPDLMCLAKFCKVHLGWLPEKVHKYLRKNVWSAACMRALCKVRSLQVPTSDGSAPSKPLFRIDREMTHEGNAPAYKLTVYVPTFVMAASRGLQSDCNSRMPSASQVDKVCSWAPLQGNVIVPARIMQVTSPQEVIDFMDHDTNFSSQPEAGLADIVWPEASTAQGTQSWIDSDSNESVISISSGEDVLGEETAPKVYTKEGHTFDAIPNKFSASALELFLVQKELTEGRSLSTTWGIFSAFKDLWKNAKGETYHGLYHYEEATAVVTGNLALSAAVQDMMEVLKNNKGAEGGSRNHASAMTIEDMRKLMTWSYRQCSDEAVGHIFQGVHARSTLEVAELILAQRHLMLRAFSFTIWTRNFELTKIKQKDVMWNCHGCPPYSIPFNLVSLLNCKGWQWKGEIDGALEGHEYEVYAQPKIPEFLCSPICRLG